MGHKLQILGHMSWITFQWSGAICWSLAQSHLHTAVLEISPGPDTHGWKSQISQHLKILTTLTPMYDM